MPSQNIIRRHWGISIALSVALHLAVFGVLLFQARKNANKEEKEIEFIPIEIIEVQPEGGMPIAEPEPVAEPEAESPQEPEPVAEPEPEPEPEPEQSIVVEAPKQEEKPVEKPKKEEPKPKPKPVEKPKPKQPTLEERIRNAKVVKGQPARPQQNKKSDIDKRLERMRNNTSSSSSFGKTSGYSSGVTGVSQSEMAHYQAYNARCVAPTLSRLWTQLGPNALDTLPNDVVITFNIDRNGRVAFCSIARRSNNIAMNNAAERLCDALRNTSFPPFSQVGLKAESNVRSIPFEFTLKYQH